MGHLREIFGKPVVRKLPNGDMVMRDCFITTDQTGGTADQTLDSRLNVHDDGTIPVAEGTATQDACPGQHLDAPNPLQPDRHTTSADGA